MRVSARGKEKGVFKSGFAVDRCGWVLVPVMLAVGCRSSVSPLTSTEGTGKAAAARPAPNAENPAPKAVSRSGAGAVPESVLAERGLMTLWTKEPAANEGAVRSVFLLREGLFAVTRPDPEARSWRLIRYELETGLPKWFYELEEPLDHPPVAYHYGPSGTGPRPDELYIIQKDVLRCLDLQYGADMWRVRM